MPASVSRPALIGRDADMARLHELLDEAIECMPRAVAANGNGS